MNSLKGQQTMKIFTDDDLGGADGSTLKFLIFLSGFTYPTAFLFSIIYFIFLTHMHRDATDMELLMPPMFIMYLILSPIYVFSKTYRYYFVLLGVRERFHEKTKQVDRVFLQAKKMLKIFNAIGVSLFLFSFYKFYGCATFVVIGLLMPLSLIGYSFMMKVQVEALGIKGIMNNL